MRSLATAIAAALMLAGCATSGADPFEHGVRQGVDRAPGPVALSVCHGYGCAWRDYVSLSEQEWRQIRAALTVPATTAAAERARIAAAIGLIERLVGARLGTVEDRAETPFNWGDANQLDCVDESINTSTYLHLLENAGMLHFHSVRDLRRRTGLLHLTQHYTAVVQDQTTGVEYAVDSWFHDNGQPAEIVELHRWLDGWRPGHGASSP